MNFLKNYWAETATSVKKIALALRVLVGTVTASAFVQGNIQFAFYLICSGAILDFFLNFLPPDKPGTPDAGTPIKAGLTVVVMALLMLLVNSCTVVRPGTNTVKTDSTYTTFKQIAVKVTGAKVVAGINMDSLYHASLMQRDMQKDDSISRLKAEVQYKSDSIAALKANKPIPPKPIYLPAPPVIKYVTDPQTKAQLSYWLDEYGKLQLGCESKDQTLEELQAQVTTLKSQVTIKTEVVNKTPTWNWIAMGALGALLIACIIILIIKSII